MTETTALTEPAPPERRLDHVASSSAGHRLARDPWLWCAALAAMLVASILTARLADPSLSPDQIAAAVLEPASRDLERDVIRVTRPAIERGRWLSVDPTVRDALLRGDTDELTEICNRALATATEVDTIALFDATGSIVAINTVYADGTPINPDLVSPLLAANFEDRPIIAGCLRNDTTGEVLEFQTRCGITAKLFDASGLAIAHSTAVRDEDGRVLGVVSTRTRFERLTEIADGRSFADGRGLLAFVTPTGKFFDEAANLGGAPPLPLDTIQAALIAAGPDLDQSAMARTADHAVITRPLDAFETNYGGELRTLAAVPAAWLQRQHRRAILDAIVWPAGMLVLIALVAIGRAANRRIRIHADRTATMAGRLQRSESELQDAMDRMQRQRTELLEIVDDLGIGLWELEADGLTITGGGRFRSLVGLADPIAPASALPIAELLTRVHAEDRDALEADFHTATSGEPSASASASVSNATFDRVCRLQNQDGKFRSTRVIGVAVGRNMSNGERSLLGALVDVHDLVEAQQRLDVALRAADVAMWDWDVEQGDVVFNDIWSMMLGFEPGELRGHIDVWEHHCHPDDRPFVNAEINRHVRGESDLYSAEHRLRTKSGDWLWVRGVGRVIERTPDGNPKRMVGVNVNIDTSKRLDLSLRSAIGVRTGSRNLQSSLTELCEALASVLGVDMVGVARPHDVDGVHSATMIAGWMKGGPLEPFTYALEGTPCAVALDHDCCVVRENVVDEYPDDQLLKDFGFDGYAGIRLRDSHGQSNGILVALHGSPLTSSVDVEATLQIFGTRVASELERADSEVSLRAALDAADAANRAKSEFLANMSHEIRTPMTAILGYSDLLCSDDPEDRAGVLDAVESIHANARHLLTVINDILDVSRIEVGQMQIESIAVSPATIIQEAVDLCRSRAEGKGLTVDVRFETDLPRVIRSDPTRMRQILLNLLNNGIKFTETGSITVRVACDPGDERLSVAVEDTGIGMSAEQVERLRRFEAFSQADTSITRTYGGSGLGLRISNALAHMLGGEIQLESRAGRGSTFTCVLATGSLDGVPRDDAVGLAARFGDPESTRYPAAPGTIAASSPGHAAKTRSPRPLTGTRIMLVEDGPDNQRLLSFHLRKAGADVIVSDNGRLAVDHLAACPPEEMPHLICMDMQMPVLDGYSATRELRTTGCDLPVLALTAHAMEGDRQRCLDAGCDRYLSKPVDREALIRTCAELIRPDGDVETDTSRLAA